MLTGGGDAPGMNAAVRAVTRAGLDLGWEVCGVRQGYAGLIAGDFIPLGARDVGGIIQHGVLVGLLGGEVSATPLGEVVSNKKKLDLDLLEVARILARRPGGPSPGLKSP